MLSQNGLAKAKPLNMHTKRLTGATARQATSSRHVADALCIIGSSGSYVVVIRACKDR